MTITTAGRRCRRPSVRCQKRGGSWSVFETEEKRPMQSGNNIDSAALIDRLERAGKLLVEAIGLAKDTKSVGNIAKHRRRTASTPRTTGSIDFTSGERAFI